MFESGCMFLRKAKSDVVSTTSPIDENRITKIFIRALLNPLQRDTIIYPGPTRLRADKVLYG
jgi:hypothetical protein